MIAMSTAGEIRRLKVREGLGTKEIAKRLGISRNNPFPIHARGSIFDGA